MCPKSMESTANLHVVAALVAGLAALALGYAILVDLAVHDIARIGPAVGAFGIGLFLDHEFATVPARLGWRLAGRAVLLHEAHLALSFVVERVGRTQILLAGLRGQPGARAPVAAQEGELLLLLGLGRHDHRLGRILLVFGLRPVLRTRAFALILVDVLLARSGIGTLVVRSFLIGLADIDAGRIGVGRGAALDRLAVERT